MSIIETTMVDCYAILILMRAFDKDHIYKVRLYSKLLFNRNSAASFGCIGSGGASFLMAVYRNIREPKSSEPKWMYPCTCMDLMYIFDISSHFYLYVVIPYGS
jgi:hypothetical protein